MGGVFRVEHLGERGRRSGERHGLALAGAAPWAWHSEALVMRRTSTRGAVSPQVAIVAVPGGAVDAGSGAGRSWPGRRRRRTQGTSSGTRCAFTAVETEADGDGGHGGAAQDQQRRLRVSGDAPPLAVDRGADEGDKGQPDHFPASGAGGGRGRNG